MKVGDVIQIDATVTRVDGPYVDLEVCGKPVCVMSHKIPYPRAKLTVDAAQVEQPIDLQPGNENTSAIAQSSAESASVTNVSEEETGSSIKRSSAKAKAEA